MRNETRERIGSSDATHTHTYELAAGGHFMHAFRGQVAERGGTAGSKGRWGEGRWGGA